MAIVELLLQTIILPLPIRELYRLHFSQTKKYLCTAIFALGGFVILTGIVRIVGVYKHGQTDIYLTQRATWLNVLLDIAILCAFRPRCALLYLPASSGQKHARQ